MKSFDGYLKLKLGNDYVLLAGGGTKDLNEFSMAHSHPYSYNHLSDWDYNTAHDSNYVTFDKFNGTGGPDDGWYNGFVTTHSNYLSSYLVNKHRTHDWYLGWNLNSETARWTKVLTADNTNINNGVITINGVTITPLTSHQSLANYVTAIGNGTGDYINQLYYTKNGSNNYFTVNYSNNSDKVDGYHANKTGSTDIAALSVIGSVGLTHSYILVGTLPLTADTGTGLSKVLFTVYGMLDYGAQDETICIVTASSRDGYSLKGTILQGANQMSLGYVLTSNAMQIWLEHTGYYRGTTVVRIDDSNNFTLVMSSLNTKPSNWVAGNLYINYSSENLPTYPTLSSLMGNSAIGTATSPIYWSGSAFVAGNAYPTKSSWNYDDRYVSSLTTSGNYLRWVKNGSNNDITVPYATNSNLLNGRISKYYTLIYCYSIHNSVMKVGTATNVAQGGSTLVLRFYTGIGYNADVTQHRSCEVIIRASNGSAGNGGLKFSIQTEGHIGGTFATFYMRLLSDSSYEIWMSAYNYSGWSFYEVVYYDGITYTNNMTAGTLPTSNIIAATNYNISYSGHTHTWDSITSKPAAIGGTTNPVYWNGSGFVEANSYPTKASWNYNDMYVASVSISGNNLRINKNGANTDLTIPYATSSNVSNYLNCNKQISVSPGAITAWTWYSTGILGTSLDTGIYVLRISINTNGPFWSCNFVGLLYWFSSGTNASEADEVIMHSAGHANNSNMHIYIRTLKRGSSTLLMLMTSNINLSAYTYTFRFFKIGD